MGSMEKEKVLIKLMADTISTFMLVSSFVQPLDIKVSELYFMSNDGSTYTFDVLAGLTHIPAASTTTIDRAVTGQYTGTVTEAAGPNWSGSAGVG